MRLISYTELVSTNFNDLILKSSPPEGTELRAANAVFNSALTSHEPLTTLTRCYATQVTQLLERQNAELTVIKKELQEQRAVLQRRNTHKKGKRVRLQGEFVFSTADVLKIAWEAEEKPVAKRPCRRPCKRLIQEVKEEEEENEVLSSSADSESKESVIVSRQPHAPSDFVMYEPPLPCNILVDTPPQTSLRISLNIQVPPEHDIQGYDTYEDDHPLNALVQRACPLTLYDDANNAKITRCIQQIQKDEQENNAEQEEYEARVTTQMTAADYEAAETLGALQSASERQRSVRVSSQHSGYDIQRFDSFDLSAQRNSSPALRTNNNLSNIQRSSQPLTPRNKNNPGSHPQSSGSKARAPQLSSYTLSPSTNNPQEERTAFKLAKQLRKFQGYTHEQYQQADQNHQEHH
ncbi:hypothetical protein V502_01869 [Pseudogymnoascus sp. VKM F-4520 (FW-2644)]|nr:hypothetical protein V502_01869 [Pseudogymnoascus sp. VKM F-4520 (FW-2644)]